MNDDTVTTHQKSKISQILATTDIRLVQGADEHLQVLNLVLAIAKILNEQ